MLYKINNGLGKIKLGWSARSQKQDDEEYDRVIEYLRHNPDSKLEDVIKYGNKYDERYLHNNLKEYKLDTTYSREWYDGTDPAAKKEINKVWQECKKIVEARVTAENEIYRENHPEIFND